MQNTYKIIWNLIVFAINQNILLAKFFLKISRLVFKTSNNFFFNRKKFSNFAQITTDKIMIMTDLQLLKELENELDIKFNEVNITEISKKHK